MANAYSRVSIWLYVNMVEYKIQLQLMISHNVLLYRIHFRSLRRHWNRWIIFFILESIYFKETCCFIHLLYNARSGVQIVSLDWVIDAKLPKSLGSHFRWSSVQLCRTKITFQIKKILTLETRYAIRTMANHVETVSFPPLSSNKKPLTIILNLTTIGLSVAKMGRLSLS